MTPDARELADVLHRSALQVEAAVRGCARSTTRRRTLKLCIDINRLENEGDAILRRSVARLFKEEKDPILIIKWKEIYENLEKATRSLRGRREHHRGRGPRARVRSWRVSTLVVVTIVVALLFDFINGFHDAANSIATVVSTRVLSPRIAVLWAAFFNFIALLIFQDRRREHDREASSSVRRATRRTSTSSSAGWSGAIVWNLFTWWLGLAVVELARADRRLTGAGIAYARRRRPATRQARHRPLEFIVVAPLLGMVLGGLLMMLAVFWVFRRMTPAAVDRTFRSRSAAVCRLRTRSATAATTRRRRSA